MDLLELIQQIKQEYDGKHMPTLGIINISYSDNGYTLSIGFSGDVPTNFKSGEFVINHKESNPNKGWVYPGRVGFLLQGAGVYAENVPIHSDAQRIVSDISEQYMGIKFHGRTIDANALAQLGFYQEQLKHLSENKNMENSKKEINLLKELVRKQLLENYYDIQANNEIYDAKIEYNNFIEQGDKESANNVLSVLKQNLDMMGYDWHSDPEAAELISNTISEQEVEEGLGGIKNVMSKAGSYLKQGVKDFNKEYVAGAVPYFKGLANKAKETYDWNDGNSMTNQQKAQYDISGIHSRIKFLTNKLNYLKQQYQNITGKEYMPNAVAGAKEFRKNRNYNYGNLKETEQPIPVSDIDEKYVVMVETPIHRMNNAYFFTAKNKAEAEDIKRDLKMQGEYNNEKISQIYITGPNSRLGEFH